MDHQRSEYTSRMRMVPRADTGLNMAIHLNTNIKGVVLFVKLTDELIYEYHVLNSGPEDLPQKLWERDPNIVISGVKFKNDQKIGFVNDLDDPTSAPFFW